MDHRILAFQRTLVESHDSTSSLSIQEVKESESRSTTGKAMGMRVSAILAIVNGERLLKVFGLAPNTWHHRNPQSTNLFAAKPNANPGRFPTAFRDEPEHDRSVAAQASRLRKKCSASSRENLRECNEGRMPLAEKWVRGKEAALLPALRPHWPGARPALRVGNFGWRMSSVPQRHHRNRRFSLIPPRFDERVDLVLNAFTGHHRNPCYRRSPRA
jgi:hypothetical protein